MCTYHTIVNKIENVNGECVNKTITRPKNRQPSKATKEYPTHRAFYALRVVLRCGGVNHVTHLANVE